MHRFRMAAFVLSVAAGQATDAFKVVTSSRADVHQETLQALNPPAEVFPGSQASPYGAALMKKVNALIGRVDEFDRSTLVAEKIGAGFDRSITGWRAQPSGGTVALAVRYHRDRLLAMDIKFSNDYGGPEPPDPGDFEVLTVAVCSRGNSGSWSCREDELAAVARTHSVALPNGRAERDKAVARLLELVLTERQLL